MTNALNLSAGSQSTWERLGPVACGGTVSGLAISPVLRVLGIAVSPSPYNALYWAATSCGTFRSYTRGISWEQYLDALTTPLLSTLAVAINGYLFAGAVDGSLFYSDDFGLSWKAGEAPEELRAPVLAIVVSPKFRSDRAAFAATAGGGVLVTRDAGKSWQSSSAGLADTSVNALAVANDWSNKETLFAAGETGVHVSVDAGRTWRKTKLALDDDTASALAVSPAYESDQTLYAGTEGGKLYRSANGGRSWSVAGEAASSGAVSALWLSPDFAESGRMVCGMDTDILVSSDRGRSWRLAAQLPDTVLTLAGDATSVIAGLYDAGVWESRDGGQTWAPATGNLAARPFAWLNGSASRLYAAGPQEGIWASDNGGEGWQRLSELAPYLPLAAVCTSHAGVLLAATQQGDIVRSTDQGLSWQSVAEAEHIQALYLSPETGLGWAGSAEGRLWVSGDQGATWQDGGVPCQGQAILSIIASPAFADDHTLLMGAAMPASEMSEARVVLWHSKDGGATWSPLTSQPTTAGWAEAAMLAGATTGAPAQAVLAAGQYVLTPPAEGQGQWISTIVDPSGANVLSVVSAGVAQGAGQFFAATSKGVFCSADGGRTWTSFGQGLAPQTLIVSLAAVTCASQPYLYALSLGGVIWKRALGG